MTGEVGKTILIRSTSNRPKKHRWINIGCFKNKYLIEIWIYHLNFLSFFSSNLHAKFSLWIRSDSTILWKVITEQVKCITIVAWFKISWKCTLIFNLSSSCHIQHRISTSAGVEDYSINLMKSGISTTNIALTAYTQPWISE